MDTGSSIDIITHECLKKLQYKWKIWKKLRLPSWEFYNELRIPLELKDYVPEWGTRTTHEHWKQAF